MNETMQVIMNRKSMRQFLDKPIPEADKIAILTAATQAPTAGNQQLYTIIDVTDQKLKDELVITCDNQPFIADAPLVLIFCADCKKWFDAYVEAGCEPRAPRAGDLMLAVSDANIAAQNAVIAADSLGLGSCYIGDIMERYEIHKKMFNLPEYVFPAAMLVIGYPTEQQQKRIPPKRVDLPYVVHENAYQPLDGAAIRAMFAERSSVRGYDEWMTAFCNRKYNSEFSGEMSRSVECYIDEFFKNRP